MATESVVPAASARVATKADVAFVVATSAAAAAALRDGRGANLMLEREMPAPDPSTVTRWLNDDETVVLIGELDAVPVGVGSASVEVLSEGSRLAVASTLWVDPEARGLGVGEALLAGLVAWARGARCSAIDAFALPGERITKNFFEAAGFKARLLTVNHRLDADAS